MKTILFFFATFGIVTAAASFGGQPLDFGTVFAALAAGTLYAMALHDTPRTLPRPVVTRFPARQSHTYDLAA